MWEKFDEATMGIVVRHIRRSALRIRLSFNSWADICCRSTTLPDYVYDEGERQPKLAQKRVKVC
jgi:poly(A) polymerase